MFTTIFNTNIAKFPNKEKRHDMKNYLPTYNSYHDDIDDVKEQTEFMKQYERDYNSLVDDYNLLLDKFRKLNEECNELKDIITHKEKRDKEIKKMEETYSYKKYEKIGEQPNNPTLTYKGLLKKSIENQYDLERKLLTIKEVVDMTEKNIIEPTISVDMISKIIFQDKKGIEEVKKFIED